MSRTRRAAGLLAIGLLVVPGPVGPAGQEAGDVDSLARELAGTLAGVQVAVWKDGRLAATAAAGWASVDPPVAAGVDTQFPVFSAAKAWTATAAARLVEQGRLRPEDRVGDLVPDFPTKRWPFTVLQLAEHQAGIRHYRDAAEAESPRRCRTVSEAVGLFAGDPLLFEPGTRTAYSSWGYVLLSRVVELRAGVPFPEALDRLVLTPAGMTRTVAASAIMRREHVAESFRPSASGRERVTIDPGCKWGAGGYYSTAVDLVRFYGALTSGGLVSPAMRALILRTDADGRFSFGGASLGGQSRVVGNIRTGVFVAIVANERRTEPDLERAADRLRARYE